MPCAGVHRHHRGAHDPLVVQDRVARGHQRIAVAPVGEDLHPARLVERRFDLLRAEARALHFAVTVRIADGLPHDPLALLARGIHEDAPRLAVLPVHAGLDHLLELPLHGLLGVGLHPGVDRGVDLQSVAVDVVGFAVGLAVLVTPAVDRVVLVLPDRLVVVPLGVELVAARPLGVHHQPQHLAEIGRRAGIVRHGVEVEHDRQRRNRIALFARERPGLRHARKHQVAARHGVVVVAQGGVTRRGVHHAHQHGGLLHVQLVGLLVEEGVRRRLDAVGVRTVLHRIEVHGGDLLLRVVVFELERRDPLLEFRRHEFRRACDAAPVAGRVAREEVLGQLLRDRRTAALRGVLQQQGLHRHARQRGDVDARMVAEAHVLRGDQRRDDGRHLPSVEPDTERRIGGEQVGILHVGAVLHEERADHLAVLRIDLRGEVAARVLQLLERRDAAESSQRREQQHHGHQREGREGRAPDPFYRLRADAPLLRL